MKIKISWKAVLKRALVGMFCAIACGAGAFAAQEPSAEAKAAGDAYAAKDWKKSEELYGKLANSENSTPQYWYRLGVSEKSLGESEAALKAFEKSETAGMPAFVTRYAMAEVHAQKGEAEAAFTELNAALKAGYGMPEQLEKEADFAALRNDARFAALVEQAKKNETPCKYSAENRQFDFWVGEWSVVTTQGEMPAGDSRIELALGDCVIVENWTSKNSGYAGKSYNVYNLPEKRWEQFWVDNSQGTIQFFGGLKEGVMDFYTGQLKQPDGSLMKRHLQFIPQGPDRVRQFSQMTKDEGKTWQVEYDFTYKRKK